MSEIEKHGPVLAVMRYAFGLERQMLRVLHKHV